MPSPVGGLGACPQKKNQFCAKDYAILSKFWYFFPILQQKVGGLSPSPESGGPIPCPPCSDAYAPPAGSGESPGRKHISAYFAATERFW